jgi:hypothetical protein
VVCRFFRLSLFSQEKFQYITALATFSISQNYFSFQYHVAKEQARLHEKFDAHLASGVLDHYLSKVSSSMVATMPCIYMYLQMITSLTC